MSNTADGVLKGEPRAPFDAPIETLKQTNKPIVSVDIPSAWE